MGQVRNAPHIRTCGPRVGADVWEGLGGAALLGKVLRLYILALLPVHSLCCAYGKGGELSASCTGCHACCHTVPPLQFLTPGTISQNKLFSKLPWWWHFITAVEKLSANMNEKKK